MNDHIETKDQGSGMSGGHALDLKLPIGWLIRPTASCSRSTGC